jgi:uncharacterized protein YcnI
VRIPEGVTGVKPQPKQAWKLETTRVKLSPPLDDGHGGKITETVGEVAWSGGALADEHFDEFMMMRRNGFSAAMWQPRHWESACW